MSYLNINYVLSKLQYLTLYATRYMTDQCDVMCGCDGRRLFWLRWWWCPWQKSSVRRHDQSRILNVTPVLLAYAPRLMVKNNEWGRWKSRYTYSRQYGTCEYALTQFIAATTMCVFLLNCNDHIRFMFRHEPSCLKGGERSSHKTNCSIWLFIAWLLIGHWDC